MNTVSCISPCKLNLFLYITGRRLDGKHNLQTLFTILDYGDEMTFTLREDNQINLDGPFDFPKEENLIYKAAKLLQNKYNCTLGLDIKITKSLAQGGGLGGGSSNAATTLIWANKLWNLNLDTTTLKAHGLSLGADVPIFIHGTSAFAEGVGEILTTKDLEEKYYVVAMPDCHVSTKEVFSYDDLKRDSQVRNFDELWKLGYHNDFEICVFKHYPEVFRIFKFLSKFKDTHLSGSGGSLFIECNTKGDALNILAALKKANINAFVAKNTKLSLAYQNTKNA